MTSSQYVLYTRHIKTQQTCNDRRPDSHHARHNPSHHTCFDQAIYDAVVVGESSQSEFTDAVNEEDVVVQAQPNKNTEVEHRRYPRHTTYGGTETDTSKFIKRLESAKK
jgi:hypothetical protein